MNNINTHTIKKRIARITGHLYSSIQVRPAFRCMVDGDELIYIDRHVYQGVNEQWQHIGFDELFQPEPNVIAYVTFGSADHPSLIGFDYPPRTEPSFEEPSFKDRFLAFFRFKSSDQTRTA
jgi:hypothetical protein